VELLVPPYDLRADRSWNRLRDRTGGWSGSTARLAASAEILCVAFLLVVWAPWQGWPHVFAATGLGLVVEHRRRNGSWKVTVALAGVVAGLAFGVATLVCLFT